MQAIEPSHLPGRKEGQFSHPMPQWLRTVTKPMKKWETSVSSTGLGQCMLSKGWSVFVLRKAQDCPCREWGRNDIKQRMKVCNCVACCMVYHDAQVALGLTCPDSWILDFNMPKSDFKRLIYSLRKFKIKASFSGLWRCDGCTSKAKSYLEWPNPP